MNKPPKRNLAEIEAVLLRELKRGPLTSVQAAEILWPDSESWKRPQGRGVQGLARLAARVMHHLKRAGKVHWKAECNRWYLGPRRI